MRPSEVSQSGLRRFRRELTRRPPPELPREAPTTLSLVVPCFRHAEHLPDLLDSIVAQTRPADEVIFVDDASPDSTNDVLTAFVATRPGLDETRYVILVNERNLGQAASLNRAIAAATSELVMVANDDDYLMHDAIESMLALFAQNRGVALIGAHCIYFAGHEALVAAPKLTGAYGPPGMPLVIHRPEDVSGYRHYNDLNMTHSSCSYFKTAWEAVGGYRADKKSRVVPFSDRDFQLRVNAVWPVAVAYETPFSLWRTDASVDQGLNS